MQLLSRVLRNKEITGATLFVFSTFIQRGLSLITTPIYTRLLSSYDYGVVSTYNTWYGILSVIFTLSIAANAFNNGLVKFKKDRDTFVSSMVSLTGCLVLTGFVLVTIFRNSIEDISGIEYKFFCIMFINMFCDVIYGFWGLCSKFDGKYIRVVVINLSLSFISIIVTITAVLNFNSDLAFVKIVAGSITTITFAIIMAINYIMKAPSAFLNSYWKHAVVFCVPLIPHYMSNHLLNQADRIMITSMCGAEKTGIYTIAYKLPEILNICWTCLSSVYVPWLYKKLDDLKESKIRKTNTIIMGSISIITFAIILLGPEIMWILASKEYYEGIYLIPALVTGYYGLFICLICSHIELFYNKNKFITFITLISATINIGLNYIFIPKFGYMAAAYTTYLGYFIMLLLHSFNIKRLKLSKFINLKFMISMFVFNSFIGMCALGLYNSIAIRYVIIGIIISLICFKYKKIIGFLITMKEK